MVSYARFDHYLTTLEVETSPEFGRLHRFLAYCGPGEAAGHDLDRNNAERSANKLRSAPQNSQTFISRRAPVPRLRGSGWGSGDHQRLAGASGAGASVKGRGGTRVIAGGAEAPALGGSGLRDPLATSLFGPFEPAGPHRTGQG